MRLSERLQAAIDILNDVEQNSHPVSKALKNWGVSHRFAGSGDRTAIGNIVYDAMRYRSSIAWRMQSESVNDIIYGALLCDRSIDIATVRESLINDSFVSSWLNDKRQFVWQNRHLADAPIHIQADVPQWCLASLEKVLGADLIEEGKALAARSPLDLRVNTLKATSEKVAKVLIDIGAVPVKWYKDALRVAAVGGLRRYLNVQIEPAFQKGWFEIQDLGSQIATHLCRARPGMQIMDYCAGAGGKTIALAADMKNRGQIHAYDVKKLRLAPIFARLRRAGVRNTQVYTTNIHALTALSGHMDIVVVDAPCTGSGTWRRRPDIKWRLTASQLRRCVEEQRVVLDKAAVFVRQGGRLVYITCSLLFEENDGQIRNFLAHNTAFQMCNMSRFWFESIVRENQVSDLTSEQVPMPRFSKYGLVLSPFVTDTDGFFVSIMEKRS
ncbi:MAG: 16S rRNA (cytosine967-C5)-methyltransferase [Candidatus Tokpelaia sp. JSC188]|nr:MAG: 16S rRNA (cytosine967-C5)-methyltransferase [Candidatus Tokpelaia sp. JSC188]